MLRGRDSMVDSRPFFLFWWESCAMHARWNRCRAGGWLLVCLGGSLLVGCQGSSESDSAVAPTPQPVPSAPSEPESSPPASDISVETLAIDQLADLLARHQGQVVLIDYWATWCGPCLQKFPHTIELSHQFADAGLHVISVSCDDPGDRSKVVATLQKLGAEIENYQTDSGLQETFDAFDIRGGIPFYQLYDREGSCGIASMELPPPGTKRNPSR
jgi:thiol-disulfide isomerase/thioredoxin